MPGIQSLSLGSLEPSIFLEREVKDQSVPCFLPTWPLDSGFQPSASSVSGQISQQIQMHVRNLHNKVTNTDRQPHCQDVEGTDNTFKVDEMGLRGKNDQAHVCRMSNSLP